jgi:hypothetical protein
MSTAARARHQRRRDHQWGPVRGRPTPTLDVSQSVTVEAEPSAFGPHDESWRPFPYYGERPDDRPTLAGLIKSRLAVIFGKGK